MKTLLTKFVFSSILFAVSVSIPVTLLQAEEVDFSCMSYIVKGKTQVSENYKEYDIAVHNRCPGAVYWSMCIERMDPWTNEVQVGLTPSGKIEKQKKTRVNLQMKQRWDESGTRDAYQAFHKINCERTMCGQRMRIEKAKPEKRIQEERHGLVQAEHSTGGPCIK